VSDVLLRLAAAASKARLTIRRFATYLETAPKLEELLLELYAKVAPDGPALEVLKPPSCWNEKTGVWDTNACPAANAEFFEPPTPIPGADGATRRFLLGLQCEGS
jgi:hypothetical protein